MDGGNPKDQWESDKWHKRTSLLTSINWFGRERKRERENEKEREKKEILERETLPSL